MFVVKSVYFQVNSHVMDLSVVLFGPSVNIIHNWFYITHREKNFELKIDSSCLVQFHLFAVYR